MVAINDGADGVAKIAQHMPAIRDLDRVGRTLAHPVGIRAGPVASAKPQTPDARERRWAWAA
jgi:hypothetical protein